MTDIYTFDKVEWSDDKDKCQSDKTKDGLMKWVKVIPLMRLK
jgi:hypothetical protein